MLCVGPFLAIVDLIADVDSWIWSIVSLTIMMITIAMSIMITMLMTIAYMLVVANVDMNYAALKQSIQHSNKSPMLMGSNTHWALRPEDIVTPRYVL